MVKETVVEIFRTDIQTRHQSLEVIALLHQCFPGMRVHIDLHDCDKVLRTEAEEVVPQQVIEIVTACGYRCEVLG